MKKLNASEESTSQLAPFTSEKLRNDVGTILFTVACMTRWVFARSDVDTNNVLRQLFASRQDSHPFDLGTPEYDWQASGMRYENVATTQLAEVMETLYEFAFLGHLDTDVRDLDSESTPSWLSRVLVDLSQSHFVAEWDNYSKCRESIERCLQVVETAQARLVLEGLEHESDRFLDWRGPDTPGLTFRQLSLLSGMTEPSLRTLASSGRKNPLKTQSDGRNAYIAAEDAKAWLIAKARYVPIKRTSRSGRHDPTAQRFQTADELLDSLNHRLRYLLGEQGAHATLEALQAMGISVRGTGDLRHLPLDETSLDDAELMTRLGEALALRGPLLALRAAEVRATDRIRSIELQIRRLQD